MSAEQDLVGGYVAVEAQTDDARLTAEAVAVLAVGAPDAVIIPQQLAAGGDFDFGTDDGLPVRSEDDSGDSEAIADQVGVYLKRIGKEPLLSAEEEVELAKRIEAGLFAEELLAQAADGGSRMGINQVELQVIQAEGEAAKDRFLKANLRLVTSVARRYIRGGMPYMELIQEGNIGLVRAVEGFDYTRGFKFSTYATWWIRQAITRALASQARTVRLPTHVVEDINKINKIQRELYQQLGREPTPEEVGRQAYLPPGRVAELQGYNRTPVSLNTMTGPNDGTEFGDLVADDDVPDPTQGLVREALQTDLQKVLASLSVREQQIVRMRFGLDDGRRRSLKEIAVAFGLSRERIRQIEKIIMKKLRDPSRTELLKDYYE